MNIKVAVFCCMLIGCILVGNVSALDFNYFNDSPTLVYNGQVNYGGVMVNKYLINLPASTNLYEIYADVSMPSNSGNGLVLFASHYTGGRYIILDDITQNAMFWAFGTAYSYPTTYDKNLKLKGDGGSDYAYEDDILKKSIGGGNISAFELWYLPGGTISYSDLHVNAFIPGYVETESIIMVDAPYNFVNHNVRFTDASQGMSIGDNYTLLFGDGYSYTGNYEGYGQSWIHSYDTAGEYNISLSIIHDGITYTGYCNFEAIEDTTCAYDISLSLSKTSSITPLSEYITMNAEIIGTPELIPGSSIGYYFGSGSGGTVSPTHVATFTNTTNGSWLYNRNDLGITSSGFTTYEDILSEQIRFPDAGNYVVRFAVVPYGSCSKYVDKYVSVNPSSQVNLDIYFKDGITYNMIPSVTSAISIVNVTGNTTYSGNPIGIATQIGQNVSIYATAEGYTPKHIYYTIPSSVYGNTLDIPFFMFPTDYGEYYPDNTTWTISVKSITSGENIYGASVRASDYSGTIDEGYTNSDGYVTLFVPFRDSPVRLDVARVPYISSSQWVNLGNATEYATTVYLNYGGTPTPTPSYNYTYTVTPTQTDTPIPTVTQITNPMLTVWVRDAITNLPIGDAYVYIYDGDEIDQTYKGSLIYSSTTDSVQGATPKLQMIANNAYWVVVSKSGYYTLEKRFRMSSQDASIFAPLQPSHGVTIATTQPTLVLPTPGGTGIQGGFIGWILDYFSEWFGVDNGTARILLALFIITCSSVFVGGSLAGFGSGAGAGMGALIGGMFAFIAMCYVQFLPFWLLPIGIAFVGMAFFVWNRQDK